MEVKKKRGCVMLINQNVDAYDRKTEPYIVAYIDILGTTNKI